MRTNSPQAFKQDRLDLVKRSFTKVIPRIWLFCFDATKMVYAQQGIPLEVVRLGNKSVAGFEVMIHRTHMEVINGEEAYQVNWDFNEQTGKFHDFHISSNWNSDPETFALTLESIVDHTVRISQQVQVR